MSINYLQRLNSFTRRRQTNLTCISLFSGGGGLDLGAYLARFRTLLASDIKPSFIQTIHHNLPEVNIYAEDAMQLNPQLLRHISKLEVTVNKGKDFHDLWNYMQEETGYQLFIKQCNAYDYGIPQSRERIIIVGFSPDINCNAFEYPVRPHRPYGQNKP